MKFVSIITEILLKTIKSTKFAITARSFHKTRLTFIRNIKLLMKINYKFLLKTSWQPVTNF